MWVQEWQRKRKQMGNTLLRYQKCNSRTALKSMEVEARDSVSSCQIYFPIVIEATHTNFKMFSQLNHMQCS